MKAIVMHQGENVMKSEISLVYDDTNNFKTSENEVSFLQPPHVWSFKTEGKSLAGMRDNATLQSQTKKNFIGTTGYY